MKNLITYAREWIKVNKTKALIAVAVLMVVTGVALAGTATVTWTHPTQNTDGSALPLSQISSTRIEYGTCSGAAFGVKEGEVSVTAPATTTTINNVSSGNKCFRAYTTANGNESGPSAVAAKVVPSPTPNPPVLTTINTVAYDVKWSWKDRGYVLNRPVGTIAIGTACVNDFALDGGFYRVSRKDVRFNRKSGAVVVAKCA